MAQSGYEIRRDLLVQAKDMLYENWHAKRDVMANNAYLRKMVQEDISPPSVKEIMELADKFYDFVQKK